MKYLTSLWCYNNRKQIIFQYWLSISKGRTITPIAPHSMDLSSGFIPCQCMMDSGEIIWDGAEAEKPPPPSQPLLIEVTDTNSKYDLASWLFTFCRPDRGRPGLLPRPSHPAPMEEGSPRPIPSSPLVSSISCTKMLRTSPRKRCSVSGTCPNVSY